MHRPRSACAMLAFSWNGSYKDQKETEQMPGKSLYSFEKTNGNDVDCPQYFRKSSTEKASNVFIQKLLNRCQSLNDKSESRSRIKETCFETNTFKMESCFADSIL